VPEAEAKISIYDSALMFGDMVFEMTRSFDGHQFKLREHIDRLFVGLSILRIPMPLTKDELELACYQTIEANKSVFNADDEHRLMIDVSRGLLGIYEGIEGLHKGTNIVIADFPLRWTVSSMSSLFETGINAVVTSQRAIPASLMVPKIKNRSRLFYLMANIEASQYEGDNNWALLLDKFITHSRIPLIPVGPAAQPHGLGRIVLAIEIMAVTLVVRSLAGGDELLQILDAFLNLFGVVNSG
jgi:branched-chain amino acid aminotransferase